MIYRVFVFFLLQGLEILNLTFPGIEPMSPEYNSGFQVPNCWSQGLEAQRCVDKLEQAKRQSNNHRPG
jgi:hypothetical protein